MAAGIAGGCLCGAVRYKASAEPQMVGHCYCEDCRRASGTSHATHVVIPEAAFELTGEVRLFGKPADSGNLVKRAFCPTCGSGVYSTNVAMPGMIFVRASSLDDQNAVTPGLTVYAARAPAWARLDDANPVFQIMPPGMPGGD